MNLYLLIGTYGSGSTDRLRCRRRSRRIYAHRRFLPTLSTHRLTKEVGNTGLSSQASILQTLPEESAVRREKRSPIFQIYLKNLRRKPEQTKFLHLA